ncbi:hypothetical protein HRG_012982 [Hirsutella rhossiliensis]
MDHSSSGTNGSRGDPQVVHRRGRSPVAEVPQLDHDSSTVPSSSPSTTSSEPPAPSQSALNPQASCFDFDGISTQNDVLFNSNLWAYGSPFQCCTTTNDDIKWMMHSISSRLDALELAVSTANIQVAYVQDGVSEVLRLFQTTEDMTREMEDLKRSLKELLKSFMLFSWGGEGIEDIDVQSSHSA